MDAGVLLDAVEEMRDAGAEVIEVNNTIRVVGSTWFGSDNRALVIDGKPISRPITFEVIGDPNSLEEAAQFRGGIVSEITGPKIGGQVSIERENRLVIESLHTTARESVRSPRVRTANASVTRRFEEPDVGLSRRSEVLHRARVGSQW